jgi:hypothetical protein
MSETAPPMSETVLPISETAPPMSETVLPISGRSPARCAPVGGR